MMRAGEKSQRVAGPGDRPKPISNGRSIKIRTIQAMIGKLAQQEEQFDLGDGSSPQRRPELDA